MMNVETDRKRRITPTAEAYEKRYCEIALYISSGSVRILSSAIIIVELSSPSESEKLKKKAIKKVFRNQGHKIIKTYSKNFLPRIFDSLCHCSGILSKVGKKILTQ